MKIGVVEVFRSGGSRKVGEAMRGFDEMKHAVCGAHILRELNGIIETSESRMECGDETIIDADVSEKRLWKRHHQKYQPL
jgi:hypothetical protein